MLNDLILHLQMLNYATMIWFSTASQVRRENLHVHPGVGPTQAILMLSLRCTFANFFTTFDFCSHICFFLWLCIVWLIGWHDFEPDFEMGQPNASNRLTTKHFPVAQKVENLQLEDQKVKKSLYFKENVTKWCITCLFKGAVLTGPLVLRQSKRKEVSWKQKFAKKWFTTRRTVVGTWEMLKKSFQIIARLRFGGWFRIYFVQILLYFVVSLTGA